MTDNPKEVQRVLDAIAALAAIEDDADRAKAVTAILDQWPDQHARLRELRQQAVLSLKASGKTWQQIGEILGVHFTRAQQIGVGKRGDKRETPPDESGTSAKVRRERLLEAIRKAGGQWDWRRAWEVYEVRPEPHVVRRDLQELCKARHLVRVETGLYEAVLTAD